MEPQQNSSLAVPIAIIFGFCMIALSIYFSGLNSKANNQKPRENTSAISTASFEQVKIIDEKDYIKGNPNAPIMLIEYSDYECPTCNEFYPTLKKVLNEFGATGKVAWIYRQYPIVNLYPNSAKLSETALCVGEVGGNTAFWKFTDSIFQERQPDSLTDMSKLESLVTNSGVDKDYFESCIRNGRHKKPLEKNITVATEAGVIGLPHTFVVVGNQVESFTGAESYPVVRQVIKDLIDQLDGKALGIETSTSTPTSSSSATATKP